MAAKPLLIMRLSSRFRCPGTGHLLLCARFMQSLMLHARVAGLHTCPQAAWNRFAGIILPHVGAAADQTLVCSMALGHADTEAIVNHYHTPRLPVPAFCRWIS
jgi:nitroreductase